MRYRSLSATGDYVFGLGRSEFLVDSPAAVAQAVQTRLALATGEWFLDTTEGTPYATDILGRGTVGKYDAAIKQRILDTPGVLAITDYASSLDRTTRKLSVSAAISTIYGAATVSSAYSS
jgi:hypothetical protein